MIELDGFMAAVRGAFSGEATLAAVLVKYYLSAALVFYPAMRIIDRFGRDVRGALILLVPLLGFVVLMVWLAVVTRPRKAGAV